MQLVDETRARISRLAKAQFTADWQRNAGALARFVRIKPRDRVTQWRLATCEAIAALQRNVGLRAKDLRSGLYAVSDRLRLLCPAQTLARGYSITTDAAGRIIRRFDQVKVGDTLSTRVTDGVLESKVTRSQAS
jgi:exodeoxyribonuclease VII large subunit